MFSEGEEVGGDVLVRFWETFLGGGEFVHEAETEVAFLAAEIYAEEFVFAEMSGGFPTDLAAEAGGVAGAAEVGKGKEGEEGGFEEVPVVGAGGQEGGEPEIVVYGLIYIYARQVSLAARSNVET